MRIVNVSTNVYTLRGMVSTNDPILFSIFEANTEFCNHQKIVGFVVLESQLRV